MSRAFRADDYVPDGSHFIHGEWVTPGRALIDVIDPTTGTVLGSVPAGEADDVNAALSSGEAAFAEWGQADPSWRASVLRKWAALLRENADVIAELEAHEVGYAVFGVPHLAEAVEFMAGQADRIYGHTLPGHSVDTFSFTLREPLGVCASIVPWNAPTALMMTSVAPGLAAGNAMVVKPSEEAPLACLYVASLALTAGLPPGVLNVITGYGSGAGQALANSRRIKHMNFTGSVPTGAIVAGACGANFVPIHLELGGKTPHIVLADANLDAAIASIAGNLIRNAGQICYAGTRVVAQSSIVPEVHERLIEAMRRVRVGPWPSRPDMGPVINAARRADILGYVESARQEGASVLFGGEALTPEGGEHGNFLAPTLLGDVTPEMAVAREEIFGPVLSVLSCTDEADAARIANDTPFGLAASIWTADVNAALRISRRLECGQVWINTFGSRSVIGAPFGGFKDSGHGRIGSTDAVYDYTQSKTIIIDASRPSAEK